MGNLRAGTLQSLCACVCLCASFCSLSLSSETLDVFAHEDAVYGLSVSPVNDNIFASSSDDGRVLIWDIRESPHGGRVKGLLDCVEEFDVRFIVEAVYDLSNLRGRVGKGEAALMVGHRCVFVDVPSCA